MKKLKALSIIEVLIAGGILAMILGATVALSRTVTKNQIIVQDRTMANSLAAEAIEQIQALNDTTKIDGVVNDFKSLLPQACASNIDDPTNLNCQGIELTKNNNGICLEKNGNCGGAVVGETDPDDQPGINDNEVIAVYLDQNANAADIISDNIYRMNSTPVKIIADTCSAASAQKIIYCRKISVSSIIINISSNSGYSSGDCNATGECDNQVLPNITEEDPAEITDAADYTFNALASNAFKVTSEITWLEFGQVRTVSQSDIITNW